MIHQSVEDCLDDSIKSDGNLQKSKKSLSRSQIRSHDVQDRRILPGPFSGDGVRPHFGSQHHFAQVDGWTDYSESEAEEPGTAAGPAGGAWRNGLHLQHPHPGLQYNHSNIPDSRSSSTSDLSQPFDRQFSRLTNHSQMLYDQSNQQLADVPEEFQEELSASIVGQHRDRFTVSYAISGFFVNFLLISDNVDT
jgi:hypothetical protein